MNYQYQNYVNLMNRTSHVTKLYKKYGSELSKPFTNVLINMISQEAIYA